MSGARPAKGWLLRRREKMVAEVRRNRAGGHRVPTWVLTALLVVFVGAWVAVIVLS